MLPTNRSPSIAILTLSAILLRWCVSVHPYSGQGKPPMYGDYEAQRHWQEITVNLPVSEWYVNTTRNDLQYWGLDYPPLTAYHSYALGAVAKKLNPDYVALFTSRGYESPDHKLFMRYTVLISDILVYFPAAYCLMRALGKHHGGRNEFLCLLLYPGLYLIDHGHFQYNAVSLGLFVLAVAALVVKRDFLGSVLFCLALNYKQMELYHALPFFCYLLGLCWKQGGVLSSLWKLLKLGISVLFTFSAVWLPFASDTQVLGQAVSRLFPFDRGLFEDKVASVWCSLSVAVKIKSLLDNQSIALLCLLSTAACVIPSSVHLLFRPTTKHFRYALVNASLVFFLLSYHVHEKSILLAAIPACVIVSDEPFMVTWFLTVSTISMLPLLIKDGLAIPTVALTVIFTLVSHELLLSDAVKSRRNLWVWMRRVYYLSMCGLVFLSVLNLFVKPPPKLPDLFPVLLSIYSCGHFVFFCIYFHLCQFALRYTAQQATTATATTTAAANETGKQRSNSGSNKKVQRKLKFN